ncbi:HAMP domain-containing sensor histidine kinase [Brevibacillus centrosporus]|nr:HAMP domain-containing sensor histidine kinase [Brevibacillus centrosporus]MEC2133429.1 HAMP domain-containing sensor histidine kinase [Brevibacillus centrosporus]RNB67744.1 sensor histidine kinase [Brevibacillus centrosporus]GED34103.1 two-component sensor histidine kinase [Brevibacillus centrosporus]
MFRINILWKMIAVNALVLGIAIWLAAVSVKDFACYLVNQLDAIDQEKKLEFSETMHYYLLGTSILAICVSGFLHYAIVKKVLYPIKQLSKSARMLASGRYPEPLHSKTQDEVGQLTGDFQYLVDKMRRGEALRTKMLGDLAHELRTPLTNVIGYLEALSGGILKGTPDLYSSLHDETMRIARLVEQIHELNIWEGKRQSGKKLTPLSMEKVIVNALKTFELELQNRGISYSCHLQDQQIEGAEDGITQALINVLKNAIEHNAAGWIRVEGKREKDQYQVFVTNQGRPITAEHAEFLFERFYRIDPSRNRETGGAGLGLAIVKEIVELHGGKVGFQSNEDIHTFWFTIPVCQKEAQLH